MNLKRTLIISLVLLLTLLSCGQKTQTTKAKLTFDTSFLSVTNSLGGVYFFGKNNSTGEDFAFTNDSIPTELELTNGNWTFLAAAWDADGVPNQALEGAIKCARLESNLTGTQTDIKMSLNALNCNDRVFGSDRVRGPSQDLLRMELYKCAENLSNCTNSTPQSFQVILKQKDLSGHVSDGLVSRCIADTVPNTTLVDASYNIKAFTNHVPTDYTKMEIRYFTDSACTNFNYSFIPTKMPQDINLNTLDLNLNWMTENMSTFVNYYTVVPICNTAPGQSAAPFNSEGNQIICNVAQLQYIGATGGALITTPIKFLSDIDLGGTTFTNSIVANNFLANIDGNGKRIFNGTIDGSSQTTSVGIFQSLTGSDNYVSNLLIDNIRIISPSSAGYSSGALAGSINGFIISNIKIDKVTIDTNNGSIVGSIAGSYTYSGSYPLIEGIASISNITINSSSCNKIGGAFGEIISSSSTVIKDIKAQNVSINLNNCSGTNTAIGGIIGQSNISNTLMNLSADNILIKMIGSPSSLISGIGGIIGQESSPSSTRVLRDFSIKNSKIGTSSYPLKDSSNIGGVIGNGVNLQGMYENFLAKDIEINPAIDTLSPNSIGGVIGRSKSGISKALFNGIVNAPGLNDVGGIIGAKDSQQIIESKSFGTLTCANTCGGIVGKQLNPNGNLEKLYSAMNIQASGNTIGGIIGYIKGSEIHEVGFEGQISASSSIGGIAGVFNFPSTTTLNITNSYTAAIISDIDSGDNFGLAVGNVSDTNVGTSTLVIQQSYFKGKKASDSSLINQTINISNANSIPLTSFGCMINSDTDSTDNFGCGQKANMNDPSSTFLSSTPVEWMQNAFGAFELKFILQQKEINGLLNLGSTLDPYIINNTAQWNKISDEPFYMNKAFILNNNLDFQNGAIPFKPIGSSTNGFGGVFMGNGKTLRNIYYPASSASTYIGVFAYLQNGARINDHNSISKDLYTSDTLQISNAIFEPQDAQYVGILAGKINDSSGSIVIKNIKITDDSSANINIHDSQGTINIMMGGAIGFASISSPETFIDNIKVKRLKINAYNANGSIIGGVFGKLDMSTSGNLMRLVYSGNIDSSNANSVGGVFGNINSSGNNIEIMQPVAIGSIIANNTANSGGIFGTKAAGNLIINESKVNMNLSSDTGMVGCISSNSSTDLTLDKVYAICPYLTGTTIFDIAPTGFNSTVGTLHFYHNTLTTGNTIAVNDVNLFKSYDSISSILGGQPWPEFEYSSGLYPYISFEAE